MVGSLFVLVLLFALSPPAQGYYPSAYASSDGDHWGYDEKDGPETWGNECQTGNKQSPIDIHTSDVDYALLDRVNFGGYDQVGKINLANKGHTVVASGFELWKPHPFILGGPLNGKYLLQQFHFHWGSADNVGSEHRIMGRSYPAEVHLVHVKEGMTIEKAVRHPDGLVVVGIFLKIGNDGKPMATVWKGMHHVHGYLNESEISDFWLRSILPANTDSFYTYEGSLTTPGCSEVVQWIVMAEPVSITKKQLHEFHKMYNSEGVQHEHNYRPTQPLNGRRIRFRSAQYTTRRVYDDDDDAASADAAHFTLVPALASLFLATVF